ncbi:hypothetical protein CDAR_211231 [Caerostris darwini]|uniref:Uncharacterized protein n=1 Tax=Caerostris darwini TaxID=1538125 RepID=A0AAV4VYJ6_9ARAC|nr:hypothetical protein CDAR_211231 [Caerostris darwini]
MDFNALPLKVPAKSRYHTSLEADHLMEMPKNQIRSLISPHRTLQPRTRQIQMEGAGVLALRQHTPFKRDPHSSKSNYSGSIHGACLMREMAFGEDGFEKGGKKNAIMQCLLLTDFNALPRKVPAKYRNHTSLEADHLMEMPKNKIRSLIPPHKSLQPRTRQIQMEGVGVLVLRQRTAFKRDPHCSKRTDSGSFRGALLMRGNADERGLALSQKLLGNFFFFTFSEMAFGEDGLEMMAKK